MKSSPNTTPDNKPTVRVPPPPPPPPVEVKTNDNDKAYDEGEFLFYFNKIPPEERKSILKVMEEQSNEKYVPTNETNNDASIDAMSKLFKAFMEDCKKTGGTTTTSRSPPTPIPLAYPAQHTKSGLEINLASRKTDELESTRVILFKYERGNDPISKKKTRDKVVTALDPKISTNNISRIITSEDATSFDVATDALSWQAHLQNIRKYCTQYDMLSILSIPIGVDYSNPSNVLTHTEYKDAITHWKDLDDEDYFQWQEFLLRYGSTTEMESDAWLEDTLHLSLEKTLKAEIDADVSAIPLHQRGSLTTIRCIIKRLVVKNQESRDALVLYITDFDIMKFPGENVPLASLRLKAVARALGTDDLPKNTIRKVLDGFAKSSTKSFNDLCASQIALRRGSLMQPLLKITPLHTQLVDVLNDLEATYLELVGGHKWEGISAQPLESSFKAEQHKIKDKRNLRGGMAWDDWVKEYAKCVHCGKIGHIRPHCPKYLAQIESGEIQRTTRAPTRNLQRGARKLNNKKGDRKAQALLSAFNAIYGLGSDSESDHEDDGGDDNEHDTVANEEEGNNQVDEDRQTFLSMIGSSLKD
jgi:hypothetical protein